MPTMYHKDSKESIDVHPSQVESAQNSGWQLDPVKKEKPKAKEVKENGKSHG